jgi:hypothetical protein
MDIAGYRAKSVKCGCPSIRVRMRPLMLVLHVAAAVACSTVVAADNLKLGINYTWYRLDATQLKQCTPHSALVLRGGGIIEQYSNPEVRREVHDQLEAMQHAGFSTIRTLVSVAHRPFGDHKEGLIGTSEGEISQQDQDNIRSFVSDIVAAGFGGLEVSYGFLLESNPYCRRTNWGDCFDSTRTDENWRFIAQATRIVNGAAKAIPHRFDLQNEGCPSRYMAPQTVGNASQYLTTIAARFRQQFGENWLISCPDSPNSERLKLLLDVLKRSNLIPKYVEIHGYSNDVGHVRDALAAANSLATESDARLILGELRYHSEKQARVIRDFMRAEPNHRIVELIQWPLALPESDCPIDSQPPYSLGPYETITRN